MKYRKDFVTNSSSSSFVCEICGAVESGWDARPCDIGMIECENGHVICESEALPHPSVTDMIDYIIKNDLNTQRWDLGTGKYRDFSKEEMLELDENFVFERLFTDEEGLVPECMCPICQFIEYSQSDMAKYLEMKYGVPRDEVFAEVKKFNRRRKKLYDIEYIAHVCKLYNLNPSEIVAGWKSEFKSYREFAKKNFKKLQ